MEGKAPVPFLISGTFKGCWVDGIIFGFTIGTSPRRGRRAGEEGTLLPLLVVMD